MARRCTTSCTGHHPIPAERVLVVEDQQRLMLGGRTFEFIDAPGHAATTTARSTSTTTRSTAATTSASCYRELDTDRGPVHAADTTPVQLSRCAARHDRPPHVVHGRSASSRPLRPGHRSRAPRARLARVHRRTGAHRAVARPGTGPHERIRADMFRYFSTRLDEHGYAGDLASA